MQLRSQRRFVSNEQSRSTFDDVARPRWPIEPATFAATPERTEKKKKSAYHLYAFIVFRSKSRAKD